jgi:hypothetical protein
MAHLPARSYRILPALGANGYRSHDSRAVARFPCLAGNARAILLNVSDR